MTTNDKKQSSVHGLFLSGPARDPEQPGIGVNMELMAFGNPTNNVNGTANNQWVGSVALPAIGAGVHTTVTYTNTKILATSRVFAQVRQKNTGDTPAGTVPAAGAAGSVIANAKIPVAGSIVFDLFNAGAAATLGTDYVLDVLIINGV